MELNITLKDLIEAYRNVKIDMYYEQGHLTSQKFANYEADLIGNLEKLLEKINSEDLAYFKKIIFTGNHICVLKKAEFNKIKNYEIEDERNGDTFIYRSKSYSPSINEKKLEIDFRIIGLHSVDFHVLSSLWIQKVGFQLDKKITNNSYGCRINTSVNPESINYGLKTGNRPSQGNFKPYISNYRNWQDNGINSISNALKNGDNVIAVTADLKKYYHRIDCSFITNEVFLEVLENHQLSSTELALSNILITAIKAWSNRVYNDENVPLTFKYHKHCGVPMGIGASKVIANLLLVTLDKQILEEVNPLYYGRYVDDLFIVLKDTGKIKTREDFWSYFEKRIDVVNALSYSKNKSNTEYEPNGRVFKNIFSANSLIEFGNGKEKYFFLEGVSGETFLQTLKESMNENSSEWRLPPDSDNDIEKFSETVTESSSQVENPVSGLHKSDGVTIQRQKFKLFLKRFDVLLDIMPGEKCNNAIIKYLEIATEFTIRPETISIYSKFYADLLGLSIKAKMYYWSIKIIDKIIETFDSLNKFIIEQNRINEVENIKSKVICIDSSKKYQILVLEESLYKNIHPFETINSTNNNLLKLISKFEELNIQFNSMLTMKFRAKKLFLSDLHSIPFKDSFHLDYNKKRIINSKFINYFGDLNFQLRELPKLDEFNIFINYLESIKKKEDPSLYFNIPYGLYFYTRPFKLIELSTIIPEWYLEEKKIEFERTCTFFNIEWFNPSFTEEDEDKKYKYIGLPSINSNQDPTIAFTSLKTKVESWNSNVRQENIEPDSTRIGRILDLTRDILKCKKKIDYVIFPELSIPRNLIFYLSSKFIRNKISIIAGLEYKHSKATNQLANINQVLGLVSNQISFILCVNTKHGVQHLFLKQEKEIPAIHEESELMDVGGKILTFENNKKLLINHGGFYFAGLICNDLLNIDNRQMFRGDIDALIIIAWNSDTDTYDSLVTATATDLHSFILLVNNNEFGDTRLRGPYKASYDRDKVRVRGGELDYFVVAKLEVEKLREFQRFHRSPAKPFKPVPTGFDMSDERRKNK